MRVEYRVTKADDFVRFGLVLHDGWRGIGWTAWVGRRAIGIGGVVISPEGKAWGHFGAAEDYKAPVLRSLHRRTVVLLRRLTKAGLTEIWATCETGVPRAAAWLQRLGFQATEENRAGMTVHVRRS